MGKKRTEIATPTPDRLTVEQRRQFHPYPASSGNGPCPVCGKSVGDQVHSSRLAGNYALATPTPDRLTEALIMERLSSDNPKSRQHAEEYADGRSSWRCIPIRDVVEVRAQAIAALADRPNPGELDAIEAINERIAANAATPSLAGYQALVLDMWDLLALREAR